MAKPRLRSLNEDNPRVFDSDWRLTQPTVLEFFVPSEKLLSAIEAEFSSDILAADHLFGNHPEPHGHLGCELCEQEGRIFPRDHSI